MSSASQSGTESVPCETCDETFDHQQAMRAHHTLKHGVSLTDKTCKECGEVFYSPRETQQFCSRECKSQSQVAKETATCDCCYAEFTIRPYRRRRYRSLYCSKRCKGIAERKRFGNCGRVQRYRRREGSIRDHRPDSFKELVRHAYAYEGHTIEATRRIVDTELDEDYSDEEVDAMVDDVMSFELNVRNRVWALRPEDLGLSPIGEVAR